MRWTKLRLLKQAREESKASRVYFKAGYRKLGKDEAAHAAFLRRIAKARKTN